CLTPMKGVEVTTARADEPWKEGPDLIGRSDGVVIFLAEGARWLNADAKVHEALTKLAARGGGVTVLHWGMGTKDARNIDAALKFLGGCNGGRDRKYKVLEAEAAPADAKHPILAGVGKFKVKDEFYYKLKFAKDGKLTPLLRVPIDGDDETVA